MTEVIDVPILAFGFKEAVDGLPLFHHWLSTAKGLFIEGYEALRELPEVTPVDETLMGNYMDLHTVFTVKGIGRMSIILFGITWTYLNKDALDSETKTDFLRHKWDTEKM